MPLDFKFTDNSDAVRSAVESRIQVALEAVGLTCERKAKELAPVDTGNLRNSLTHLVDDTTVYIGTNVEYGKYQELGTYKMKAQPFLRPAVEQNIGEYQRIIQANLSDI